MIFKASLQSANGCKDDADDEEGREYSLGRQDRLPSFEALLLECRAKRVDNIQQGMCIQVCRSLGPLHHLSGTSKLRHA